MIKVLITGSNGFVGKHLIHYLNSTTSDNGSYKIFEFDLAYGKDIRDFESIRNSIDQIQPD